jgi:hypothetical protein
MGDGVTSGGVLVQDDSLAKRSSSESAPPGLKVDNFPTVRRFQIIIGVLLVVHFVALARELPDLLSRDSHYCLALSNLHGARAPWPCRLDAAPLRMLLAACIGLSAAIGVGLMPRVIAALVYLLSVALMHAMGLLAMADDLIAVWVLLWATLLPLVPFAARLGNRTAHGAAWVVAAFTASWLLLNAQFSIWQTLSPSWPNSPWGPLALILVPLCALVPNTRVYRVAFLIAVAVHLSVLIRGGTVVATGLVCASGLFMLSGPELWRRTGGQRIHAAGAVALVLVSILAVNGLTEMLRIRPIAARSHTLLSSLGLAVDPNLVAVRQAKSAMFLETEDSAGIIARAPLRATGRELVGWNLVSAQTFVPTELRQGLAKTLVASLCHQGEARGRTGFVVASRDATESRVSWFDCTDPSPSIVIPEPDSSPETHASRQ